DIDDETRVDGYSFAEAISKVDTPKLTVHINSYGGSVKEGLAIYNELCAFKGHLITVVDGFACSAASFIFMAGAERIVPESALLMIHNPIMYDVEGNSKDLRKAADELDVIAQPSINIYCSKTGLPEEKIKEMMDNETWINAQEAFDMHFSTQMSRNEAMQSLESEYVSNLVNRIKEQAQLIKQYQNQDLNKKEPKNSWEDYFG
ncbi:MAG: Clp protease ClpP, partial [Bacilli bacterium]|nr:Clp protease ClpP [Bacilli bacterium]